PVAAYTLFSLFLTVKLPGILKSEVNGIHPGRFLIQNKVPEGNMTFVIRSNYRKQVTCAPAFLYNLNRTKDAVHQNEREDYNNEKESFSGCACSVHGRLTCCMLKLKLRDHGSSGSGYDGSGS
ncbi:MAG: hypothetical protein Q4C63_06300, partial [Eubacteriales bacterium]|nr:hypothetical protein [Eubacteriales bacterium]